MKLEQHGAGVFRRMVVVGAQVFHEGRQGFVVLKRMAACVTLRAPKTQAYR